MPTAAEALTPGSTPEEVTAGISACISTEVKAGREQTQAVAMCHQMARDAGATVPAPRGVEGRKVKTIGG